MNANKVLELAYAGEIGKIIELATGAIKEKEIKETKGVSELKRYKAALKYLKNSNIEKLKFTYIENGKQIFCNGYTGFCLNNHIEGLPQKEDHSDKYYVVDTVKRAIDQINKYSNTITTKLNISDIKSTIKIIKSEKKSNPKSQMIYEINNCYYNPQYLLECYNILGGGEIEFLQQKNGKLVPAILKNHNGMAVICPIRPPKNV